MQYISQDNIYFPESMLIYSQRLMTSIVNFNEPRKRRLCASFEFAGETEENFKKSLRGKNIHTDLDYFMTFWYLLKFCILE